MSKFFCLVEGKSLPNNPRTHTTRELASQESLRLATMERKTTYVVEVLETYEVEVKKTYDRSEVIDTKTLKDGDEGVFFDKRNGNQYKTLVIGKQEWMNENLRYSYNESKDHSSREWSKEDEGLYSLNEDKKNGYLYQWSAAMRVAEGLPDGWRLPTKEDLEKANLGGNTKWNKTYAGFSDYDPVSTFFNRGSVGYLWSSTAASASNAWYERFFTKYLFSSYQVNSTKSYGFSVRLVRDLA